MKGGGVWILQCWTCSSSSSPRTWCWPRSSKDDWGEGVQLIVRRRKTILVYLYLIKKVEVINFVNLFFEFLKIINYFWKEHWENFSDSNSTAQCLSNDTKHDISWKCPSDSFDFNFLGFLQIACYLAELFRQIASSIF